MKANLQNISEDWASPNQTVILPFTVASERKCFNLFLNVQKIMQVREYEEEKISPLPSHLLPLSGIFDYTGIPIPLIDIKHWLQTQGANLPSSLNLEESPCKNFMQPRILICHYMQHLVGLIVDKTRKVKRVSNTAIMAAPAIMSEIKSSFINSVIHNPDGFEYSFDIESFMDILGFKLKPEEGTPLSDSSLQGRSILLVEDSQLFQRMVEKILKENGAKVEIASNGEEGLACLLDSNRHFDLALVDIEMPIMNGIEMVHKYLATCPKPIPILFHSSIANPVMIEDIRRKKLGDYIVKFNQETVLTKINEMLA